MPSLVYIHGFLSSSQSHKAQTTKQWLRTHHPDWQFYCPDLPSSPTLAQLALHDLIGTLDPEQTALIGSSMGGFWATYLCELYGMPTVLVNPAISPQQRYRHLVGVPMQHYYHDEVCILTDDDADLLAECDRPQPRNLEEYWLMAQTGDQVLDYRLAVERYQGARQTVEEGGSHSFDDYEAWLPDIFEFIQRRLS